ncbi:hypothetical protein AC519_0535 [Pseudomonas savastanoi]|nr:hypothetical protein AC519_0535 [Pseudomonas savastanoi]
MFCNLFAVGVVTLPVLPPIPVISGKTLKNSCLTQLAT